MNRPYHRNPDQILSDRTKRCVALQGLNRRKSKPRPRLLDWLLAIAVILTAIISAILINL